MINPCSQKASAKKSITKPVAPKFQTAERSHMKGHFQSLIGQEEEQAQTFKARELNKRILNSVSKLPEVSQKDLTTF
jgi:Zn-dependent oligopeptidase